MAVTRFYTWSHGKGWACVREVYILLTHWYMTDVLTRDRTTKSHTQEKETLVVVNSVPQGYWYLRDEAGCPLPLAHPVFHLQSKGILWVGPDTESLLARGLAHLTWGRPDSQANTFRTESLANQKHNCSTLSTHFPSLASASTSNSHAHHEGKQRTVVWRWLRKQQKRSHLKVHLIRSRGVEVEDKSVQGQSISKFPHIIRDVLEDAWLQQTRNVCTSIFLIPVISTFMGLTYRRCSRNFFAPRCKTFNKSNLDKST